MQQALLRWMRIAVVVALVLVLCGGLEARGARAQTGILRIPAPGLWDAAGRSFAPVSSATAEISSIRLEVGEFRDSGSAYNAVAGIGQKIEYFYAFGYEPVVVNNLLYALPYFDPDAPGHTSQIEHNLYSTRDQQGTTYADLLFSSVNRLIVVELHGSPQGIARYLDPIAYGIWQSINALPPESQTSSNQIAGTGLWKTLALPANLDSAFYDQDDYLPVEFTGLHEDYSQSTPALDAGKSVALPSLTRPQTASTVTTPTKPAVPTATIVSEPPFDAHVEIWLPPGAWPGRDPFSCAGIGQYSDLHPGATVTVVDALGRTLVHTPNLPMGSVGFIHGYQPAGYCKLYFAITDVPGGVAPYTLFLGNTRVGSSFPTAGDPTVHFIAHF